MEDNQTIELTPDVKTDWNKFQDHLDGDYPTSGALNEFNGKNPKSQLTESHIPAALNYIQSIKQGDDVPGLTPAYRNGNSMRFPVYADGTHPDIDEMRYNKWRGQLPQNLQNDSDYDLKALYKANPNQQPSANLHFPDTYKKPNHITFSDESMYNGQNGAQGGHWGKQGKQDTFEATDTNIKNAGGIDKLQEYFKKNEPGVKLILPKPITQNQNPSVIPKPDYNDPKSRDQFAQRFSKKYGEYAHGRGDFPLRVDETMDEATDTARNLSTKAASQYKDIDPTLLYTSAMEEGMSGLFKDKKGESDFSGDKDYPTNGSHNFGLDNFVADFPTLVKGGYLPASFKDRFKAAPSPDKSETQNAANYKSPDDALVATAATLKMYRDKAEAFAKKNNIQLTPKQTDFFMLTGFNSGGNMQKMMKEYKEKGFLTDDKVDKDPTGHWTTITSHVAPRLVMRDALKKENIRF